MPRSSLLVFPALGAAPLGLLLLSSAAAEPGPVPHLPFYLRDHAQEFARAPRAASLAWFDEARLGIFIHWGVWAPRHAAWALRDQNIPLQEYRELAREFRGDGFDANKIVELVQASGARYLTFVAKHHDGFCLWNSEFTDFDSWDYPVRRDFLAELSAACHQAGVPLFIYYSIGIDWTHPDFLPRRLYPTGRATGEEYRAWDEAWTPERFENYRQFCKNQLAELCSNYGPIAGFWFDPLGGVLANEDLFKMQEFYDVIHAHQPQALILFKTGATGTEDVLVGERKLESISMHYGSGDENSRRIRALADAAWERNRGKKAEICVTSQGSWEWGPERRCRSAADLYGMLRTAAGENANLLLNFGPEVDGSIPADVDWEFRALGERIRTEGYPPLNREDWLQRRGGGAEVDDREEVETAR